MNEKKSILIATIKHSHINNLNKLALQFPEKFFSIITKKEELTKERIDRVKPDIIFFPHWSWIIEKEIIEHYECVIFHTSDLPFGRGGSPLQNQIVRGIYNSKVCALRANTTIDGGDIYCRRNVFIGLGSIDEIIQVISNIIFDEMIPQILAGGAVPEKQSGSSDVFVRRKKADSNLQSAVIRSLPDLFDFVRMLDGEGYPRAFIELENLILELSEVHLKTGVVNGRFEAHEKANIDDSSSSGR